MSAKTNILDAAAALAKEEGVTALGVERVVQEAGASKGAFFYHFKNKEEMVSALLDHVSEQCMRDVEQAVEGGDRFTDAFVDMVIDQVCGNGALIAVLVASVSLDPTLKDRLTERRQRARSRMVSEDGMSQDQADTLCLAIDGAMIGTVLYGDAITAKRKKSIASTLRRIASGNG
ncbi:MAG: TetR/AcrR family transcriptional regulator [Pseudomonadota bacterium]